MTPAGLGPFWQRSGVMYVSARAATVGPTEAYPVIKTFAGWAAFNVPTGEWADERKIAARTNLDVVAWMRTRTRADLDTLLLAKKRWAAKAAIFNVEIPDTRDPRFMADVLLAMSKAGTAMVVTDGWADPSGAWHSAPLGSGGFRKWVGSPECFPQENPHFVDVRGCVEHAGNYFRAVLPTLGAYGTGWLGRLPTRADYDWPASQPFIVYPGDSVERWPLWVPPAKAAVA